MKAIYLILILACVGTALAQEKISIESATLDQLYQAKAQYIAKQREVEVAFAAKKEELFELQKHIRVCLIALEQDESLTKQVNQKTLSRIEEIIRAKIAEEAKKESQKKAKEAEGKKAETPSPEEAKKLLSWPKTKETTKEKE